jgi:beta-glucosidase
MSRAYSHRRQAWTVSLFRRLIQRALLTSDLPGPNGVNTLVGVSAFVAAQTSAMSFDRDLVAQQHAAMAEEFKRKGYSGNLGPVTGPLGRSVKDGRLFENFGNDPYLNGKLFASAIIALQSNGVVSTGKHYLGMYR